MRRLEAEEDYAERMLAEGKISPVEYAHLLAQIEEAGAGQ